MAILTALKPFFPIFRPHPLTQSRPFYAEVTTEVKAELIGSIHLLNVQGFQIQALSLSDLINRFSNPSNLPKSAEFLNLFKSCLNKYSIVELYQLLKLDEWQTEGDKDKACERILENFLEQNMVLDLSGLNLTTLPKCLLSEHFNFAHLVCKHNRIGLIPEKITRKTPFTLNLSYNVEFNQKLDFTFKLHQKTSIMFEETYISLKNKMRYFRMRQELLEKKDNAHCQIIFSKRELEDPLQIFPQFFNDLKMQAPLIFETITKQSELFQLAWLLHHCSIINEPYKEKACRIVATSLQLASQHKNIRDILIGNIYFHTHPFVIISIVLNLQFEIDLLNESANRLEADRLFNMGLFVHKLNYYEINYIVNFRVYKALFQLFLETDLNIDTDLIDYIMSFSCDELETKEIELVEKISAQYSVKNLIELIIFEDRLFNLFLQTIKDTQLKEVLKTQKSQDLDLLKVEIRRNLPIASCEDL